MIGAAIILRTATAPVAFIAAAVLAFYDKPGWGWLLFCGLLSLASITNRQDGTRAGGDDE